MRKEEGVFKDGEFHGLSKFYSEGGQLIEESYWKNNVRHGEMKAYTENGILDEENNFKDGELNGLCKTYDEKGKLIDEVLYLKGRPLDDKLTQELLYGDLPDDTPLDSL